MRQLSYTFSVIMIAAVLGGYLVPTQVYIYNPLHAEDVWDDGYGGVGVGQPIWHDSDEDGQRRRERHQSDRDRGYCGAPGSPYHE